MTSNGDNLWKMSGDAESNATEKLSTAMKIAFQSSNYNVRKQALINLQKYISNLHDEDVSQTELQSMFNETHIHTLNAFRDKSEAVRSQAIKFMSFLVEILAKNDYYLTYIFPILVERIGSPELIEQSEEIRLELVQFMRAIILKYTNSPQLAPFLNDCVTILCETVTDKHPAVKEVSCKCITDLAQALPRDFHLQANSLVKPVLSIFGYQRFKIRVEAIMCMSDIIMYSNYEALEKAITPMASRLFDSVPAVRQAVAQVAARWLTEYRDRYSAFHKLLPLILTGLNDEIPETQRISQQLWEVVGMQYLRENENDLKDQLDFLREPPKHYPKHLRRPNLGCRVLVQRNVSKIVPALARELGNWQADVKIRCSQLLCAVVLHAEDGLTQHLQDLLAAMYLAARDEDQRVVENVIQASELIGIFVSPKTWTKLILPAIEDGPLHYGLLRILAGLIRGAPQEYIARFLEDICKVLAEDSICRLRTAKYQEEMIKCVRAVFSKCNTIKPSFGEYLFTIIVTTVSLRNEQNEGLFDFELLDELCVSLRFESRYEVWNKYTRDLLNGIKRDPKSWCAVTAERCIFESVLLQSGEAFGENLDLIGNILKNCLDTEVDAESRLQIFAALSTALDSKDSIFKNAPNKDEFLKHLLEDVLVPTLVWHAGRTAETMRTIATSCLCSVLNPGQSVNLFTTTEVFQSFFSNLLPLLLSLTEDNSARSRQLALEAIILLKINAVEIGGWTTEDLLKIYPEILKRLDDPMDNVRVSAIKTLPIIFQAPPEEFKRNNYKGHHEFILDTLLTHFDDDDDDNKTLQNLITECLKEMANVAGKGTLIDKLNKHKPLLRNRERCEEILAVINEMQTS